MWPCSWPVVSGDQQLQTLAWPFLGMSALPPKADILRGNINPPLLPAKLFPASTHTGHKLPAVGPYTIAHIARISAASARAPASAARRTPSIPWRPSDPRTPPDRWTPSDPRTPPDRRSPSDRWSPSNRWCGLSHPGCIGDFVLVCFRNAETRFWRGSQNGGRDSGR